MQDVANIPDNCPELVDGLTPALRRKVQQVRHAMFLSKARRQVQDRGIVDPEFVAFLDPSLADPATLDYNTLRKLRPETLSADSAAAAGAPHPPAADADLKINLTDLKRPLTPEDWRKEEERIIAALQKRLIKQDTWIYTLGLRSKL